MKYDVPNNDVTTLDDDASHVEFFRQSEIPLYKKSTSRTTAEIQIPISVPQDEGQHTHARQNADTSAKSPICALHNGKNKTKNGESCQARFREKKQ